MPKARCHATALIAAFFLCLGLSCRSAAATGHTPGPDAAPAAKAMGGYLVPRALAFEHRIKYGVVDGGVLSVFDGVMQQFPAEIKKSLGDDTAASTINQLAGEALQKNSSLETFIAQMLWTFQADTPFELFRKLQLYTIQDVIGTIDCEMLVLNSVDDRVAGSFEQAKFFTNALKGKKTYLEFSTAEGGQFHCQNGAPMLPSPSAAQR